jgi:hypothetical protein
LDVECKVVVVGCFVGRNAEFVGLVAVVGYCIEHVDVVVQDLDRLDSIEGEN